MCVTAGAAVRLPSLLPPLVHWCLSESVLSHFTLLTQQEVVCFFFFFVGVLFCQLSTLKPPRCGVREALGPAQERAETQRLPEGRNRFYQITIGIFSLKELQGSARVR